MPDYTKDPDYDEYQQYLSYIKTVPGVQKAQAAAPNAFQTANNQDLQEKESTIDKLRKYADMATSVVGGIAKGATLGNGTIRYPGMQEAMDQNPTSTKVGQAAGSLAAGAGIGSMFSGLGAGNALTRILSGAAQGATQAGLTKPADAPDTMGNRADAALKGATAGGLVQGGLEGASALKGILGRAGDTLSKAYQYHTGSPELQDEARQKIYDAVANTNTADNMTSNLIGNKLKSPLTALASKNPDRMSEIKSLGEQSGTDLADYASQMKSASKIAKKPILETIPQTLIQGLKGGAGSMTGEASSVNSPQTLGAILQLLKGSGG